MKYLTEISVFAAATVIVFAVLFFSGFIFQDAVCPDDNFDAADYSMKSLLLKYQGDFQATLMNLSELAEETAYSASDEGLFGEDIQKILDLAETEIPGIATIGIFDKNGIVTAISPESHNEIVGWDLSGTPVVSSMNEGMVPQMTDLFALSEGGYAASINYPVFSPEKEYTGFVSLTFDPYILVNDYASMLMNETGFQLMVLQTDGVVLYDSDINEVGKETFGNPMYDDFPKIPEFVKACTQSFSGEYEYKYLDKNLEKTVNKKAFWTTAGLYKTQWRLICIREI
ncbi:MAG: cache domain-containing protein [Methanomicrobium sp.]|nr:cache domain-containing protein [Methanomicrobium sp.]